MTTRLHDRLNRLAARYVYVMDGYLRWPPAGRSHRIRPAPGTGRSVRPGEV